MATLSLPHLDEDCCERINGQLSQRPLSGDIHSDIQENLRHLLSVQSKMLGMKARSEWRISQPETAGHEDPDYLTPDVLVARVPYQRTRAGHLVGPAFLAVEVVSPQQGGLFNKAQVYSSWGVEYVWIINPETRECFEYRGGNQFFKVESVLRAGELAAEISNIFSVEQ